MLQRIVWVGLSLLCVWAACEAPDSQVREGDFSVASVSVQSAFTGAILEEFMESLEYNGNSGTISFAIPDCGNHQLLVGVTGRINGRENWRMTWPEFSQAAIEGWVPGKTYSGSVQLANCDYIEVNAVLMDAWENEWARQSARLYQNGEFAVEPVREAWSRNVHHIRCYHNATRLH